MTTEWNTDNKRTDAVFAIVKMAERAKVAPDQAQLLKLGGRLERAALRLKLTAGLVRHMPTKGPTQEAVGVSPKAVAGLIARIRGNLDRARGYAWQLQHLVSPTLLIDGEPAAYGTPTQIAGATAAEKFLASTDMAALAPIGLMAKLEEFIALCDFAIEENRASPPLGNTNPSATEEHLFCWAVADIYVDVTGRRATASDGDQAHQSGLSPLAEFVADAWKISEIQLAPGAHAIVSLLNDRNKSA